MVQIHLEWATVFKLVTFETHPHLLLPLTPLRHTGLVEFSGVPTTNRTQTSVIMTDTLYTLSIASCVRFCLPMTFRW